MGDEEVFKYKGVVLLESDLHILNGDCYLTAEIIEFYITYLLSPCQTGDILFVSPYVSHLLANCEADEALSTIESFTLSTQRLIIFPVNDTEHWSVLVYVRSMNAFLHFDSTKGANNIRAEKLYDAVKNYMGVGGEVSRKRITSTQKKKKNKNKKLQPCEVINAAAAPAGLPVFKECETCQQSNDYDCGIYVLAIARVILKWFKDEDSNGDLLSVVAKDVDQSVECRMRKEILKVVDDLRNLSWNYTSA